MNLMMDPVAMHVTVQMSAGARISCMVLVQTQRCLIKTKKAHMKVLKDPTHVIDAP